MNIDHSVSIILLEIFKMRLYLVRKNTMVLEHWILMFYFGDKGTVHIKSPPESFTICYIVYSQPAVATLVLDPMVISGSRFARGEEAKRLFVVR